MDIVAIVNSLLAVLTIGFGMIAWFMPMRTLKRFKLEPVGGGTLGISETRAASGSLWVAAGLAALVIQMPWAFAMIGILYLGAGVGRITSLALDGAGNKGPWFFLATEIPLAAWFLSMNLPAALG